MRLLAPAIATVIAALAPCRASVASTIYSFTSFDAPLQPGFPGTYGVGINDAGQIIGNYGFFSQQFFLYNSLSGTFTVVSYDTIGGFSSQLVATSINNSGEIAGYAGVGFGTQSYFHIFLYNFTSGAVTYTPFEAQDIRGYGINNVGQIVGFDGSINSGFYTIPRAGHTQSCTSRMQHLTSSTNFRGPRLRA